MNLIYIIGRVVSDIDYKFTYKSNRNAVSTFICKLDNGSLVKIKAFDNNADYCYANLEQENFVIIEGKLDSENNIIIKNIIKL